MIGHLLIGLGIAVVAGWLVLLLLLVVVRPRGQSVGGLVRVLPDSVRLVTALYRDPALPAGVRWRLRVALVYVILPVNLIPNFIPVIGMVDTAVVLAWALRSTVRIAGPAAVQGHWKGSPGSLATLVAVLRLPPLADEAAPRPRRRSRARTGAPSPYYPVDAHTPPHPHGRARPSR